MIFGRKRVKPTKLERLDDLEQLKADNRPILIDFWQMGCQPCRTMDGIVNELAEEYGTTAHVVKVDLGRVPDAIREFAIKSTPTFVVLGRNVKQAKKKKARGATGDVGMTQRWRGTGLVRKDVLARVLESNGATKVDA